MSQPPRYYGENDLHFLTTSTYRRTPVFKSERFKREFVATLAELRAQRGFRLLSYVLMPEHFHLLVWPSRAANPSQIMQRLKGRMGAFDPENSSAGAALRVVLQDAGSVFFAPVRAR